MVRGLNKKYDKRVIFPIGQQRKFLNNAREDLDLSWSQFASSLDINPRTLSDWKRERYSIPLKVFNKLSVRANPNLFRDINIKEPFWYTSNGSKVGGQAVFNRYGRIGGDEEYRKKKWREWWQKEGRHKKRAIFACKDINFPNFSNDLAEFTGIVMGDGSLTTYQLELFFHSEVDRLYSGFVRNLIKKLFGVYPSIHRIRNKEAVKLLVSRKKFVDFCNKILGLPLGNKLKQGLDIPDWIQGSTDFQKACVRGLVDTDGCVFNEVHKFNGKIYSYKRLNFSTYSLNLRQSVYTILKSLGLAPRLRNNRAVQLEDKRGIADYFELIGSNNPKHIKRLMEEYR